MKKMFASIIGAMLLVTTAPAHAEMGDDIDQIVELCRTDLVRYQNGDKTWMERQFVTNKTPEDIQLVVKSICYAWGKGLIEGLSTSNRRSI